MELKIVSKGEGSTGVLLPDSGATPSSHASSQAPACPSPGVDDEASPNSSNRSASARSVEVNEQTNTTHITNININTKINTKAINTNIDANIKTKANVETDATRDAASNEQISIKRKSLLWAEATSEKCSTGFQLLHEFVKWILPLVLAWLQVFARCFEVGESSYSSLFQSLLFKYVCV